MYNMHICICMHVYVYIHTYSYDMCFQIHLHLHTHQCVYLCMCNYNSSTENWHKADTRAHDPQATAKHKGLFLCHVALPTTFRCAQGSSDTSAPLMASAAAVAHWLLAIAEVEPGFFSYSLFARFRYAKTPQCTSIKGLIVSIRWYLGYLKGYLGSAGGDTTWVPKKWLTQT